MWCNPTPSHPVLLFVETKQVVDTVVTDIPSAGQKGVPVVQPHHDAVLNNLWGAEHCGQERRKEQQATHTLSYIHPASCTQTAHSYAAMTERTLFPHNVGPSFDTHPFTANEEIRCNFKTLGKLTMRGVPQGEIVRIQHQHLRRIAGMQHI